MTVLAKNKSQGGLFVPLWQLTGCTAIDKEEGIEV